MFQVACYLTLPLRLYFGSVTDVREVLCFGSKIDEEVVAGLI